MTLSQIADSIKREAQGAISTSESKFDGLLYVGQINKNCAFRKVVSRAELSTINHHRTSKKAIKYLYSEGILEVYSNPLLKEVLIDGIFTNPELVPTFNINFSEYPIDIANLAQMKILILQQVTG